MVVWGLKRAGPLKSQAVPSVEFVRRGETGGRGGGASNKKGTGRNVRKKGGGAESRKRDCVRRSVLSVEGARLSRDGRREGREIQVCLKGNFGERERVL